MTLRKTVSTRLRALRVRRDWTQHELGLRTGLETSAISHFEAGRRMPTAKNLLLLANALRTSTDYILGRADK